MVTISPSEAFVFFGAIVLGAIIGIFGNVAVSSGFETFKKFVNDYAKFIFLLSSLFFVIIVGVSLYWFVFLSNIEGGSSVMNNPINNCHCGIESNSVIDAIIAIASNFLLAIIGGIASIFFSIKYTTNQQRAIQINETLKRCLFEIIRNKNEKLSESAIKEQLDRIAHIVERKRCSNDLSEWPAFAKEEFEFSKSNYFQYLLVDDTRYFISNVAPQYPKKSEKLRAIKQIFVLCEGFNRGLQDFEKKLLIDVNNLILQGISEKLQYDELVKSNNDALTKYYQNFMTKISPLFELLDPEHPSDIEVHVTIFDPELQ